MSKAPALLVSKQAILKAQFDVLFPFYGHHMPIETARNEVQIRQHVTLGTMRDEHLTYNPEHPFMQRVPCVHGVGVSAELLAQAFGYVYTWAQRQAGYMQ